MYSEFSRNGNSRQRICDFSQRKCHGLLPVILSIAQAQGPAFRSRTDHQGDHGQRACGLGADLVSRSRRNCPVCGALEAGIAKRQRCICARAVGGRSKPAPIGAGSTVRITGFRWTPRKSWPHMARTGESVLIPDIAADPGCRRSIVSGRSGNRSKDSSVILFTFVAALLECWRCFCACIRTRARWSG